MSKTDIVALYTLSAVASGILKKLENSDLGLVKMGDEDREELVGTIILTKIKESIDE